MHLIIILLTYVGIAVGRVPSLRMSRTSIALVGAAALIAIGAITQQQAITAIDVGTILLLFSFMVLNVNLRLAGFFNVVGYYVLRSARTPKILLALVVLASGVLSALFLNDTICLLFTPFVVDLTKRSKRDPIPYLIGLATASNIGSTATITGNPQNLIIGQASGISYIDFLMALGPIALLGLGVAWLVIVLMFREEFRTPLEAVVLPPPRYYRPLLMRCVVVVIGLLAAFLLGLPITASAFVAAALLMITRLRPQKMFALEWDLLAFFIGLFIVTGAIEVTGVSKALYEAMAPLLQSGVAALSAVTLVLSNLVSNVPAVLLFRPEIPNFPNPTQAWLTLAMSSTLAGNLTLLGSVANLIVAEIAAARDVKLTFGAYLRVGVPVTVITVLIGVIWLSLFAR
jgi:Na+/H+ antiporter NhaD/arsenite permease-like protein